MSELLELWQIGEYMSVSDLHNLNSKKLKQKGVVTAVCKGPKPVAVLVPYETYVTVQRLYLEAQKTVKKLGDSAKEGSHD